MKLKLLLLAQGLQNSESKCSRWALFCLVFNLQTSTTACSFSFYGCKDLP